MGFGLCSYVCNIVYSIYNILKTVIESFLMFINNNKYQLPTSIRQFDVRYNNDRNMNNTSFFFFLYLYFTIYIIVCAIARHLVKFLEG